MELQELAMLDSLTEIPNRRKFDKLLENEWEKTIFNQGPLSLIMVNIDFLKNSMITMDIEKEIIKLIAKALEKIQD